MTADRLLVIVEDDEAFAKTLKRSFERRGYDVLTVASHGALEEVLKDKRPGYAVVDLKLGPESGLVCVQTLHAHDPDMLIVVLTGFASIATAVEAIKLGATQYLAKPATAREIEAAFGHRAGEALPEIEAPQTGLREQEWELIQRTLAEADFNISEAARRLGLHRRTLARKLAARREGGEAE